MSTNAQMGELMVFFITTCMIVLYCVDLPSVIVQPFQVGACVL